MADSTKTPKVDLSRGVPVENLADGAMMTGRVGDEEVMLARQGDTFFAVGAHCTHYHGPLADGLLVGNTVRCPWHHACFDLRTGEPLRAPALDPIACWRVEREGNTIFVREKIEKRERVRPAAREASDWPESVVITGGGAAGLAAAEMLRRRGYDRPITMISADDAAPCDRPNLSKDFLAGTAEEDWIPLRPAEVYTDQRIDLLLGTRVSSLDAKKRIISLENGKTHKGGALLIATGSEPVRLDVPVEQGAVIRYLRTFADSRAIIASVADARQVLVVGG